jgi:hypothetical protein
MTWNGASEAQKTVLEVCGGVKKIWDTYMTFWDIFLNFIFLSYQWIYSSHSASLHRCFFMNTLFPNSPRIRVHPCPYIISELYIIIMYTMIEVESTASMSRCR